MNTRSSLSTDVPVRLVVLEQEVTADLIASLSYTAADPYAVRVAFHLGLNEQPIVWVIARDLLIDGLEASTGLGDVRVWPREPGDPSAGAVLYIELSSTTGNALFEAPRQRIANFLSSTSRIVPAGRESAFVDIDTELADLLRCA